MLRDEVLFQLPVLLATDTRLLLGLQGHQRRCDSRWGDSDAHPTGEGVHQLALRPSANERVGHRVPTPSHGPRIAGNRFHTGCQDKQAKTSRVVPEARIQHRQRRERLLSGWVRQSHHGEATLNFAFMTQTHEVHPAPCICNCNTHSIAVYGHYPVSTTRLRHQDSESYASVLGTLNPFTTKSTTFPIELTHCWRRRCTLWDGSVSQKRCSVRILWKTQLPLALPWECSNKAGTKRPRTTTESEQIPLLASKSGHFVRRG